MLRQCCRAALASLPALLPWPESPLPGVHVDRDDIVVRESCRLIFSTSPVSDVAGDGVVRIIGDDIRVECVGTLRGAPSETAPDRLRGVGIYLCGEDITVSGASVAGFKAGIRAVRCDGLSLEDCDVSDNYGQRLRSTPEAEDPTDWLQPHANDRNEWLTRYGAGIYVEESSRITVRGCRARRSQNGLCLRRVDASDVYDNDFSFLSGWGIAMFRCNDNRIVRNSCDFCVRGYSHGRYSRGQDSAGILFFEQNRGNVIAFNSATHSGDGFSVFCGTETPRGEAPRGPATSSGNLIYGNDFSYAPARGIEMAFSCDNVFALNRLIGSNYGIWGGYSSDTLVVGNEISDNASAGIAVEHGSGWTIERNRFARNRRGVELWRDEHEEPAAAPYPTRNPTVSAGHRLLHNRFEGDVVGVELRGGTSQVVLADNTFEQVRTMITKGVEDEALFTSQDIGEATFHDARLTDLPGRRQAVGARAELAGRDKLILTEWGPYDWHAPHLQRLPDDDEGGHRYRVLGDWEVEDAALEVLDGEAQPTLTRAGSDLSVMAPAGSAGLYRLRAHAGGQELSTEAWMVPMTWQVEVFSWETDPREDVERWRADAAIVEVLELASLDLPYAGGSPSDLPCATDSLREADMSPERFGTRATAAVTLPAGTWRVETRSDDGVRVWVDDRVTIDNWTWHAPTVDTATFALEQPREVVLRVEHFELDGYSVLGLRLQRVR